MIKVNFKHMLLALSLCSAMLFVSCGADEESIPRPVAGFSFTQEGGTVSFTSESAGRIDDYIWDFGDGTFSSLENPTKTYTASDAYVVQLEVSGPGGSDVAARTITIDLGGGSGEDTVAPVITLEGDAVVNVTLGGTYTEPGYTANDNVDGDITDDVVVGGDAVDTNTEGTYTVTYNVSDAAGNAATEVTRDVVVAAANCDADATQILTATGFNLTHSADPSSVIVEDAVSYAVVDNPNTDNAVNTSCKVGQASKTNASPFDNLQIVFDGNIDFSAYGGFKMKIYTNDPGVNVTMKMESTTGEGSTGDVAAGPVAAEQTWEELTFPFPAAEAGKWNKLIIFFDLGDQSEKSYIFDDLMLYDREGGGETTLPTLPLDFESDNVSYTFTDFEGGVVTRIDNPDPSGANTSAKVAQMVKNTGEPFAGSGIVMDAPIDFSTNKTFKMLVWSPKASTPVLLKVENSANGAISFEQSVNTTTVAGWEELTFDFSGINTSEQYDRFTWIFENGTVGDGTADFTYFFDDIRLVASEGGGGSAAAPTDAPPTPPSRNAADVISIYGEAYGTPVGIANVPWDGNTEFVEENIASNNVLKINFDNFLGTDLASKVDASAMTHFHMDFWIADDFAAGQIFNPKWSNHAGGTAETSAFEYTKAIGDTEVQTWVSIDIPLTDFQTGDPAQRAELAQFLISAAALIDVAYIDNVYFYK